MQQLTQAKMNPFPPLSRKLKMYKAQKVTGDFAFRYFFSHCTRQKKGPCKTWKDAPHELLIIVMRLLLNACQQEGKHKLLYVALINTLVYLQITDCPFLPILQPFSCSCSLLRVMVIQYRICCVLIKGSLKKFMREKAFSP